MAQGRVVIVTLLRSDLRVHDHALFHSVHSALNNDVTHLLPLYCFDERQIELSGFDGFPQDLPRAKTRLCGFWRTGVFRARFLAEAVYDLRDRLRSKGSNLVVRFGKPELVCVSAVKALMDSGDKVKAVYLEKAFYSEELQTERRLEKHLRTLGVNLVTFDTTPLIAVKDLPFPVSQTPDVFTPFRKKVEALGFWGRPPLLMPKTFKPSPSVTFSAYGSQFDDGGVEDILPYLLKPLEDSYETKFNDTKHPRHVKSAVPFRGGETAALERLDWYFSKGDTPPVAKYKETRNGLLGHAYSTKFSPFLSLGLLSPRLVMQRLDEHEKKYGSTDNTYWVRFEILWREYFLYIARKYGTNLFKLGGFEVVTDPKKAAIKMEPGWWKPWDPTASPDSEVVRWMQGTTGIPFIDANMAELRETGFMSNRGRQNVASFLTKDLRVDWRIGAEFFESHLIDHETSANCGNWQYISGVGNDPRASRQFNPIKQGNDYDPLGEYIKTWLPQLSKVPLYRIQTPWLLSEADRKHFITGTYPSKPVIEQVAWKSHYDKRRGPPKVNRNPNERVRNIPPGNSGARRPPGKGN